MARVWYLRELRFVRRSGHATLAPPLSGRWTVQPAPQELSNRACGRPRNTSRGGIGATLSFVILPSLLAGISNDRAVHPLRVSYSDQRNHQPRIFISGCPRCDRYCPYYGPLPMCGKHGFDERERGAISIGIN